MILSERLYKIQKFYPVRIEKTLDLKVDSIQYCTLKCINISFSYYLDGFKILNLYHNS